MEFESFSTRLRKTMRARNMKQVDLAKKTNINKAIICSYLKGSYEPKQANLKLISEVLNVKSSYLLGYDVSMDEETNQIIQKITKKINSLSKDSLEKVESFLFVTFPEGDI